MTRGKPLVGRKVLFFFCPDCWTKKHAACNEQMVKVTA